MAAIVFFIDAAAVKSSLATASSSWACRELEVVGRSAVSGFG